jgi:hypothetical protein
MVIYPLLVGALSGPGSAVGIYAGHVLPDYFRALLPHLHHKKTLQGQHEKNNQKEILYKPTRTKRCDWYAINQSDNNQINSQKESSHSRVVAPWPQQLNVTGTLYK